MKLPIKIQITIGIVILAGLIAMSCGADIVPSDPENKALFNRIVDAMWLILSVPTLANLVQKMDSLTTAPENSGDQTKEIEP